MAALSPLQTSHVYNTEDLQTAFAYAGQRKRAGQLSTRHITNTSMQEMHNSVNRENTFSFCCPALFWPFGVE